MKAYARLRTMKTTAAILFASFATLAIAVVLATAGLLPLSPRALVAHRDAVQRAMARAEMSLLAIRSLPDRARPPTAVLPFHHWTTPLLDRTLTKSEQEANLAPELQDAIGRMEPIFDPTRLDSPLDPPLHVDAGVASPTDVFGERWQLASDDPNVSAKVAPTGLEWQTAVPRACDTYFKRRKHDFGDPALTAMTDADCARLRNWHTHNAAPVSIVAAPLDLPVFAAPFPGARMTSDAFWKQQQKRIATIQAHLRRKWQEPARGSIEVGSNP